MVIKYCSAQQQSVAFCSGNPGLVNLEKYSVIQYMLFTYYLLHLQQESGGTVLSTNWKEVEREKVEVKAPDGMEWRKWEQ
jgi:hypothetical protein